MTIDITSFFFNSSIEGGTATSAWATSVGQSKSKNCRIEDEKPGVLELLTGMLYKSIANKDEVDLSAGSQTREILLCSLFDKIFINNQQIEGASFILVLVREKSKSHDGRLLVSYPPYARLNGESVNQEAIDAMRNKLGCQPEACWFVYEISIRNQDELHFSAQIVNKDEPVIYNCTSKERSEEWASLISVKHKYELDELGAILKDMYNNAEYGKKVAMLYIFVFKYGEYLVDIHKSAAIVDAAKIDKSFTTEIDKAYNIYRFARKRREVLPGQSANLYQSASIASNYRPYITAIKSKPFLLLAGISGTGKSRIVRELARACWEQDSEEYKAQKPANFEMVQVKPNWHDSSELIGYVSRVGEKPEYIAGDFLKFIAKAWENQETPYFLCLDEMNLAPVEQYFAEYLSVVESRKLKDNNTIVTDPILKKANEEWYFNLTAALTSNEDIRIQFNENGIALPQNLIVVGTVNMDETTFSFSRKVLDRAMTIEMNEVDLRGGLDSHYESIGKLGNTELIGYAVEGVDVYSSNKEICENVLDYLEKINSKLEGTPFKIAYRTRNEFLLYVVNNLPYKQEGESDDFVIQRALDEITSMKVLSRIEGDETKVSRAFLTSLEDVIKEELTTIIEKSISLAKLKEMKSRLDSGYTSFWS